MIRVCGHSDFDSILSVVNDAAVAYKDVIAPDCYHEPYMSKDHLRNTGTYRAGRSRPRLYWRTGDGLARVPREVHSPALKA